MKTEILYGIHPVIEALKVKRRSFFSIYMAESKTANWAKSIISLANPLNVTVHYMTASQIKSISHTDQHQGIAAKVSPYPQIPLTDFIKRRDEIKKDPFLLLLDHVVDPQNFGALVRTAHCVGIDGILVPKDRSAPPTPVVSKVSAGALEHITMIRVTNMVNAIRELKEKGIWIVGMDSRGGESLFSFDFPASVALLIGGEQKGIRPLVKKHCDLLCAIPLAGNIDSLNASVAGAVGMYEVFRQRLKAQG